MTGELPVYALRGGLLEAVRENHVILLQAPTGSGKSTQVPQMLLDDGGIDGQILVLQPRRLAARMLAGRVAAERDGRLGDEIGFQTRFESAHSAATRVRFITEGILPRLCQSKPDLHGIGAVIFDEFHERHISVELGLGLVRALRDGLRPDLRLVIMSATLAADDLVRGLPDCRRLEAAGRLHPVEVTYRPGPASEPVWEAAAKALGSLIAGGAQGDVLIFMPGAYEIRRTIEACRGLKLGEPIRCLPLYGGLPARQQDAVMAPADQRKIIVATNVAETSLTIGGVRHVIDSGLARQARYDPGRGLNALLIEPISRGSAEQRAGRAGREGPGRCLRLWSQRQHDNRPAFEDPELTRVDLSETLLQLKALGFSCAQDFPWLEAPPAARVVHAEELLQRLQATDPHTGELTALGRELVKFPCHPRLSRLIIAGARRGCADEALLAAALLSERPVLLNDRGAQQRLRELGRDGAVRDTNEGPVCSDFFLVFDLLQQARSASFSPEVCSAIGVHGGAARQVWRTYEYFRKLADRCGLKVRAADSGASLNRCLILAMPDHVCRRRDSGSLACELARGRRAELSRGSACRQAMLLVAAEIQEIGGGGKGVQTLLSLVSEVRIEWLQQLLPERVHDEVVTVWNERTRGVERLIETKFDELVLKSHREPETDGDLAASILAAQLPGLRSELNGWSKDADNWIRRTICVGEWFPERGLITYNEAEMAVALEEFCAGERKFDSVRNKPLLPFLKNLMSWDDQQFVEQMAPSQLDLPSGRRLRLKYRSGQQPRGNARIQDLYGVTENPVVGGGRQRVLLEILAPNMRPVQVTDDLAGFWRDLYPRVKRELSKRYPKHEWRDV